jgi:hypothetical protein
MDMRDEAETMDSLLLDLHLNRLDEEQARQMEETLAASPDLAAKSRALRGLFGLLDRVDVPEPPGDLADSVMARIDEHTRPLLLKEAATVVPAGGGHDLSGSPMLSLRELIAIAACIILFVGIFVPGYQKALNIAQRNMCRKHMHLVSAGFTAYAQQNNGFLPWVGHVPEGSWLATRTPNVPRYSNTRPMFVLLQQGLIPDNDPRVFLCPNVPHARPMMAEDYKQFTDFAEPANVSYSSVFMNLPRGRLLERMAPQMVLMADRNPLFDDRAGGHRLSPYDEAGNSFSHGEEGAGQNGVRVDGTAGWFTKPTVGVDNDNIYRAGDRARYEGTEVPVADTDTFLVP